MFSTLRRPLRPPGTLPRQRTMPLIQVSTTVSSQVHLRIRSSTACSKTGMQEHANDLVVPQQGVYANNGHPSFPIANPLLFGKDMVSATRASSRGVKLWTEFASSLKCVRRSRFRSNGSYHLGSNGNSNSSNSSSSNKAAQSEQPDWGYPRGGLLGASPKPSPSVSAPEKPSVSREEIVVQRTPALDFPESTIEGEQEILIVRLEIPQYPREDRIGVSIPADQQRMQLGVSISLPGFTIVGKREQFMTVHRQREPYLERVRFDLIPRSPGPGPASKVIRADFWLNNSCVGSVSASTIIVPTGLSRFAAANL